MCKECGCQMEIIEEDSSLKVEPEIKTENATEETPKVKLEPKRGWTGVARLDDLPLM